MRRLHPVAIACVLGAVAVTAFQAKSLGYSAFGAVCLLVSSLVIGGPRATARWLAVRLAALVTLVWLVYAVTLQWPEAQGPIIGYLPRWQVFQGLTFGGPVMLDVLHACAEVAARSWVGMLAIAVAVQMRSAEEWLDLLAVILGRAAKLAAPAICLGQALTTAWQDRAVLRRSKLSVPRLTALVGSAATARELAQQWSARRYPTAPHVVQRAAAMALTLVIVTIAAANSVAPTPLHIPGTGFSLILALVLGWQLIAVIRLVRPGRTWLGPLNVVDLAVIVTAAGIIAAWRYRTFTGDEVRLVGNSIPVVLCAACALAAIVLTVTSTATRRGRHAQS